MRVANAYGLISHIGYIQQQHNPRAYGHHKVWQGIVSIVAPCGICGRLVVRGKGRWWEYGTI